MARPKKYIIKLNDDERATLITNWMSTVGENINEVEKIAAPKAVLNMQ